VVVVRAGLASVAANPHLYPDEMGYLGAARLMAGRGPEFALGSSPLYHPLYAVLLAPALRLFDSPGSAFTAVLVVNAVLGGATAALAYVSARRLLTASRVTAACAAAVAGLYPGQSMMTVTAWAENLLPLCILAWVLTLGAFFKGLEPRSTAGVATVGLSCYWTHPRGVVIVVATLAAIAAAWWANRISAAHAVAAITGLAVAFVLSRSAIDALLAPLYGPGAGQLRESGTLGRLVAPGNWTTIASRLVGQTWYQLCATGGIFVVGVIELIRRAARPPGDEPGGRPLVARLVRPDAAGAWLVVVVAALGVGASSFLLTGARTDALFYGRYVDAGTQLVLVAGVVGLMDGSAHRLRKSVVAAAVAMLVATVTMTLAVPSLDEPRPFVGEMVSGLLGQVHLVGGARAVPIGLLSLAFVGGLGLLAASTQLGRRLAVGLAAVSFTAMAITADRGVLPRLFEASTNLRSLPHDTVLLTEGAPVGFDTDFAARGDVSTFGYQWFEPQLAIYDVMGSPTTRSPWLIGRLDWDFAIERSASLVLADPAHPMGLWVLPGETQRVLASRGALLPDGFPVRLPPAAARALIDAPRAATVGSGSPGQIAVSVEHVGEGFRWPHYDPSGGGSDAARVRIGVRIWEGSRPVGPPVAATWADLPDDVLPDQRVVVDVSLPSLPPGRYVAVVDVAQIGVGWFDGGAAARIVSILVQ
jgi:hypothetical protein